MITRKAMVAAEAKALAEGKEVEGFWECEDCGTVIVNTFDRYSGLCHDCWEHKPLTPFFISKD